MEDTSRTSKTKSYSVCHLPQYRGTIGQVTRVGKTPILWEMGMAKWNEIGVDLLESVRHSRV